MIKFIGFAFGLACMAGGLVVVAGCSLAVAVATGEWVDACVDTCPYAGRIVDVVFMASGLVTAYTMILGVLAVAAMLNDVLAGESSSVVHEDDRDEDDLVW